jgi:hypothetical protein
MFHGWRFSPPDSAELLGGPAAAVPPALAARLGKVHVHLAPYLACCGGRDYVARQEPEVESHSSLWRERRGKVHIFLATGGVDAHDLGFELLAVIGELAVSRLSDEEFSAYALLVEHELRAGVHGEIDEDAAAAKSEGRDDYVAVSLASTMAEYLHALWHDVEVREGPEHLPGRYIRRRFELLQQWFPPGPGAALFR